MFFAGGAKPPQTPRFFIRIGRIGRPADRSIGRSVGSAGDAKKVFKNIDFQKNQYFAIFLLSGYISAYSDGTIKCAMTKHACCLIFIIFGWS